MHRISTQVSAARRGARALSLAGMLLAAAGLLAGSPNARAQAAPGPYDDGQIHPVHVQGNIWVMGGEPGESNVAVQVGDEGVLVVDTGVQPMAEQLLAQIKQLAAEKAGDQKAIRIVIDTDGLPDHVGGNAIIAAGGSTIVAGNFARDAESQGLTTAATVMSNINVLSHLVADNAQRPRNDQLPLPEAAVDSDVYNTHFDGEAVQLYHPHAATSDDNTMVMFRRSDVIATGDTVMMTSYPIIDVARGGSIDGELVALNKVIEMAVPADKEQGGTLIVPGHGRLCDQADVVLYKNVITTIRNRIQFYKNQGKTLAQVLDLKPSGDFDGRWGATSGAWTTRQFVEAVYNTLPAKGPSFSMQTETLVPATATVSAGKTY